MGTREAIEAQLDRLTLRLAQLERFGEDDFEDGAVLFWQQKYPNSWKDYTYVALKADGKWWLTGQASGTRLTWQFVVDEHLSQADGPVYIATEWEEL